MIKIRFLLLSVVVKYRLWEVEWVLGGFVLHQELMQITIKMAEKPLLRSCRHLDCSCVVYVQNAPALFC